MGLWIASIIVEIVVMVAYFFCPIVYTKGWERGYIKGIGRFSNDSGYTEYSLCGYMGVWAYILLGFMLIMLIVALVLFIKKKFVPKIVFPVIGAVPMLLQIVMISSMSVTLEQMANSDAYYGKGITAGSTTFGIVLMIVGILSVVFVFFAMKQYSKTRKSTSDKIVKVIENRREVKEKDRIESADDFTL